jgi:hypothetical protein
MNKFIIFCLKILFATFLVAVVLDLAYSKMYLQSGNRAKTDYIYNSNARNYDVVILGSSRANNHFVSQMFEDKGLKTFNFGLSGAHLFEASLFLKLMQERNYKIKNLIVEVDLSLSGVNRSNIISPKFLPYIYDSKTIANHFSGEEDFNQLYYIPFYRYIKFEHLIGFREMFFNGIHKKTSNLDNKGYYPLGDHKGNMKNDITNLKPLPHNKYYEEIKQICKANNINLIAVMTPMCENVKGMEYFDKIQKLYPEVHNYENVVVENKYFSSCGHMNDKGARLFTARILKDFFNR